MVARPVARSGQVIHDSDWPPIWMVVRPLWPSAAEDEQVVRPDLRPELSSMPVPVDGPTAGSGWGIVRWSGTGKMPLARRCAGSPRAPAERGRADGTAWGFRSRAASGADCGPADSGGAGCSCRSEPACGPQPGAGPDWSATPGVGAAARDRVGPCRARSGVLPGDGRPAILGESGCGR